MQPTSSMPAAWTWRRLLLVALALCAAPLAAQVPDGAKLHAGDDGSTPILASYDFETSHDSGPDTFWVHQNDAVRVDLSAAFRTSGERSMQITDAAGNRDFAEFLGYLERRDEGAVFWQFYVLFTDVEDTHNFGVTGDCWFLCFQPGGQSFWLQLRGGVLRHYVADAFDGAGGTPWQGAGDVARGPLGLPDRWQDLFAPVAFRWYFVDWLFDLERGTYDLAIWAEDRGEPLIDLRDVPNPSGGDGAVVRYFSFIGDLEDATDPAYFVDDVLFAADPALRLDPFVAPGRRQLFVERFRRPLAEKAGVDLHRRALDALDLAAATTAAERDAETLRRVEAVADRLVEHDRLDEAERLYEYLRGHPDFAVLALLKLADVRFLRGDMAGERRAREAIYGRLGVAP